MTITKYLTGGALAAMAAALALAATPAIARDKGDSRSARENMGRSWQTARSSPDSGSRSQSRQDNSRSEARSPPARQAQQAPQQRQWSPPARQAPEARQQGGGRPQAPRQDSRRGNDGAGRDWNSGVRTPPVAQRGGDVTTRGGDVATRTPPAAREIRSTGRNSTYADSNRNRTYTARDSSTYRGNDRDRQNDSYRNGNRDNYRSGDRDDRSGDRDYRSGDRDYRSGGRDYRRGDHDYRRGDRDGHRWDNRGWRNDRRYDWQRYRATNRNVYRLGRYYAPYRGYSYRRLTIGLFVDSLFYSNRYWINDPWNYRLPDVYGPYRWVRYYDDALLVDVYSGEVVDVIYDFFW